MHKTYPVIPIIKPLDKKKKKIKMQKQKKQRYRQSDSKQIATLHRMIKYYKKNKTNLFK